ncbi:MAG: hypothetical protein ABR589_02510 [Chthoniobacterales bacterium]
MLARISKSIALRAGKIVLLAAAAAALNSCATKDEPALIADEHGRESALPWNKQEKWEQTGQLGPMAERLGGR